MDKRDTHLRGRPGHRLRRSGVYPHSAAGLGFGTVDVCIGRRVYDAIGAMPRDGLGYRSGLL
jgi:hypothetical protein